VPTRKQRRRQAKERRHEYEYVYVDEEGNEVEVDSEAAEDGARSKPQPARTSAKPAAGGRQTGTRAPRKIDPPSWQRVFRRAAIFSPVMLLVVYFLKPKDASATSVVVQVAVLLLLFLPFSYYVDTLMYRQYRKRIGDPLPPRGAKKS
jgi:hypothetical protein